ncbi:hypothetical protein EZS27_010287 [termite gut metagenome]|uniref:Uncharacterized protein n=1 Tax=termite gut metagenome TaxID=433724 RepID=A0A5J4S9K0_9ZZZZ
MEKKFMKYLLFGVFTFVFSVAFVGCGEDYDSDISDLKKANSDLKTQLESAVSSLTGTVNSLQSKLDGIKIPNPVDEAALAEKIKTAVDKDLLTSIREDLQTLAETVESLGTGSGSEGEIADIQTKLEDVSKAIGSLEAVVDGQTPGINDAISALNEVKDALLKNIPSETREAVSSWAEIIEFYTEEITKLVKQQKVLAGYLAGYGGTQTVKGDINSLTEQLESAINGLQEQIDTITGGTGGIPTPDPDDVKTALNELLAEEGTTWEDLIATIKGVNPGLVTLEEQIHEIINNLITGVKLISTPATFAYLNIPAKYTYPFGEGSTAIQFTEGKSVEGLTTSVLLQVFPANAKKPDGSSIYLVDGKGNDDINSYFKEPIVKDYSGLDLAVTKAAGAIPTGLYEVVFELDDSAYAANPKAFGDLIKGAKFAIAVKTSVSGEAGADRYLLTDFVPKISYTDATVYKPIYSVYSSDQEINFTVGDKTVSELPNRFPNTNSVSEYVWAVGSKYNPTTSADKVIAANDSRVTLTPADFEPNKEFTVTLLSNADKAYAFYIGLDLQNATSSESLLWQKAGAITGINTVYKIITDVATSKQAKIKIADAALDGQNIGFRVYVINQDGTLVDPDGRAFYIHNGKTTTTGTTLDFTLKINKGTNGALPANSDILDAGTALDGIEFNSYTLTIALKNYSDGATVQQTNATILAYDKLSEGTSGTFASGATNHHRYLAIANLRASLLQDDGIQNGVLVLKDGTTEVKKYNITIKKVLPQANEWPTDVSVVYKDNGNITLAPNFVANSGEKVVGAVIKDTEILTTSLPANVSLSLIDPEGRYAPVVSAKATTAIASNNSGTSITTDTDVLYINSREAVAANPQYIGQLKFTYKGVRYGGGNVEVQKTEPPLLVKFDIAKLFDYSVGSDLNISLGADNKAYAIFQIQRIFYGGGTGKIAAEVFENITKAQLAKFYNVDNLTGQLNITGINPLNAANGVVSPITSFTSAAAALNLKVVDFFNDGEIRAESESILSPTDKGLKDNIAAIIAHNTALTKDFDSLLVTTIVLKSSEVEITLKDVYGTNHTVKESIGDITIPFI